MTRRAVNTYGSTHAVDGRAWWGLAERQTKRDQEAPNRGKVPLVDSKELFGVHEEWVVPCGVPSQ